MEAPIRAKSETPFDPARPRRLAFWAIGVMTLSQFFHYQGSYDQPTQVAIGGGSSGDHAIPNTDTGFAMASAHYAIAGVSGWSLHHHAWLILLALVAALLMRANFARTWQTWGYWIVASGLICCLFPTDLTLAPPGFGFYIGFAAVLIAVWAARINAKALNDTEA